MSAAHFQELARAYYSAWFRYHPEAAVDAGVPGYAHLLPRCTEEARGALVCLNDELRAGLEELDRDGLGADEALDYDLLLGAIRLENQYLIEIEPRCPDPQRWLPIHAVYQLTIRPVEDFEDALRARLAAIPAFLREVREFLIPRAAGIPPLWLQSAVAAARGGIAFLRGLPQHPKIAAAGEGMRLEAALGTAIRSLEAHADFLATDLAARARGAFACGEAYFEQLLGQRHFLDVSRDELYRFGQELVARTRSELAAACRALTGGEDLAAALARFRAEHPARDRLLEVYRQEMRAARAFVVARGLVAMPEREGLDVVETPAFLRHEIPFAAYCEPAPNDPEQRGYYYVTPPETDAALAEHDYAGIQHTCVHEAWPGHHLQFVTANRNPVARTLPRLLNASATLYEGWALYSESLMRAQGFLGRPEQGLLLLRDRLWRALRILIDIGIHTRGETLETGAQRLVEQLGFPPAQALAELTWYSRAPTVPLGYAVGWALIDTLRGEANLPLREFHDRLLSAGSIALPLVIRRAFGAETWSQVQGSVFGPRTERSAGG